MLLLLSVIMWFFSRVFFLELFGLLSYTRTRGFARITAGDFQLFIAKREIKTNQKREARGKRRRRHHCREMYIAYSSFQRQHAHNRPKERLLPHRKKIKGKGGGGNNRMRCARIDSQG
ncbi:hypothetical protein V8C37DRAFT_363686 [Trichoderma ceciliae]